MKNKLTPTEKPDYNDNNNKMKENDGRAARRKLNRQLVIVFSTCALSVIVIALLGGFSSTSGSGGVGTTNVSQKLRKASEDYIVGKMTDPLNRRRYRRRPSPNAVDDGSNNNEEGEEGGGDYADKAKIMAKVLKAELHLVDLSIKEDEVLRSPSNSYSGVYGIFCELDFSKHKEDPSSGAYLADDKEGKNVSGCSFLYFDFFAIIHLTQNHFFVCLNTSLLIFDFSNTICVSYSSNVP